jgi:catechol 2,3-dioxygenase-like lactoylglutathione lyase family enzyme
VFDHVEIHVPDLAASRAFYTEALGLPTNDGQWIEWGDFGITAVDDEHPQSANLHVAFGVDGRDAVDAWWNRMTEAGYASDGEPGLRPEYSPGYYGAFVRDPDGHSVEAVHHETSVPGGMDHLWLRTRDLDAAKRFLAVVAPAVGISIRADEPELVRYSDGRGSFSFVRSDEPTEHVHLAFGVPDVAAVARFHELATAAGHPSNGEPGERPEYHPGYHGSFVLFDGHNVEAVFHDRSS